MAKDNLCNTLDMTEIEKEISNIELPDDPELRDIVMFALEIYKDSMNDAIFADALEKLTATEVALNALKLSQETMVKMEELKLKARKMCLDEYKEVSKNNEDASLGDDNRREILNKLRDELDS